MPQAVKTGMTLLVIESDDATRAGMKRLLEMNGYCVNAVANENEAENAALQETFDLVLFDTNLPPPKSFSAAYRVQQRPKLRYIPLLAISVHDHSDISLKNPEVDRFSVSYFTNLTDFEELEKLTACLLSMK